MCSPGEQSNGSRLSWFRWAPGSFVTFGTEQAWAIIPRPAEAKAQSRPRGRGKPVRRGTGLVARLPAGDRG